MFHKVPFLKHLLLEMYKRNFCIILCLGINFCLLSCSLFDHNEQPLVSQDQKSLQRFNETTSFPYQAAIERREKILINRNKLRIGMNGDEVLKVIGNPDEISTLRFVGDQISGWMWSYNIYKKFERAPDETDVNVTVYFDTEGKVKKISEITSNSTFVPVSKTPLFDTIKIS